MKTSPLSKWLPTPGNILFTILIAAILLYTQGADAFPDLSAREALSNTSTTTLPYQGRLTSNEGTPITSTVAMTFNLYNVASGGSSLWSESWASVSVNSGLFSALLGSTNPISPTLITENPSLWLGIKVGTDSEMTPRVQIGSVPFALQALTVPPGAITTTMLADGSVTLAKLDPSLQIILRGFTPAVYSDRVSPEISEGLHRSPSSGTSQMNVSFKVPEDYMGGDLTVRMTFYEHDSGIGSVAKITQTIWKYRKSDGAITGIGGGSVDQIFGVGIRTFTISAGLFEAGDLIWFREVRDADNPDDNAGRFDLMTIGIEYYGK